MHPVQIVVGIKQLVRRVDLNHANLEPKQLLDIFLDIESVARM